MQSIYHLLHNHGWSLWRTWMWIWSLGKSRRSRSRVWQTFLPPCGLCQGKLYLGELHLHLWSNAQLVAELPFSELCPPLWMTSVISALWTLSTFVNDLCYLRILSRLQLNEILYYFLMMLHNYRDYPGICCMCPELILWQFNLYISLKS